MNYQQSLQRAIELANKAVAAEEEAKKLEKEKGGTGDFDRVFNMYLTALDNWKYVIKYEQNPAMKTRYN